MDVRGKIVNALFLPLKAEYIRLENEDGISGFVVSSRFKGMSTLNRQQLIEKALNEASDPLTDREKREVLVIAGLTPVEYETVGQQIRIDEITETEAGRVQILLHGAPSDGNYVATLLKNAGLDTASPEAVRRNTGVWISIEAGGKQGAPLTRQKVVALLKRDPNVQVMSKA